MLLPNNWTEYLDANGLMRGKVKSSDRDYNTLVFTPLFLMLCKRLGISPPEHMSEKLFDLYKDDLQNIHVSHDNATGVMCLAKEENKKALIPIIGLEKIKNPTGLRKLFPFILSRPHPRDIIMYGFAKGGVFKFIFLPFLWITSIAMIISCMQNYKIRNNQKFLKTDGKLLAWMRCKAFNMRITWFICNLFIKYDDDFKNMGNVAEIYYGKNHPITQLMKELDNKE